MYNRIAPTLIEKGKENNSLVNTPRDTIKDKGSHSTTN